MITYDFSNMSIVELVNKIIVTAVRSNASDIHFDPIEDGLKIRFRIDGELKDHTVVPKEYERNLTTRVKLISTMNITETRMPQDGSIKGRIDDLDLDMRVSSLPTNEGEKVVVRILDYSRSLGGLNTLGFSKRNLRKVEEMIKSPNGLILVTGATGSGKSTTTYSMIQSLNKETTNIITVEDPIEMNIEGVNQVQVNSEIGLDFATVLRSVLRQDPNVILIGEIRDTETAQIAVRASITGHLVLSTVHTNDSLSTIERLIDMEVEKYLLSTALTGVISQKLAKTLCPHCRKEKDTTNFEQLLFEKQLNVYVPTIYEAIGCEKCVNGYRGRIAIQEVLMINDEIRDALNDDNIAREHLRNLVFNADVTTLLQDGLEKVIEGLTTFEEIYRLIEVEKDTDYRKNNIVKENKDLKKPIVDTTNIMFGKNKRAKKK